MKTVHASAVIYGRFGLLVRGASGAGKSSLLWQILHSDKFSRLIADDRVYLDAQNGRLLASPHTCLEGRIEMRGVGIVQLPFLKIAQIDAVIDLCDEVERMPLEKRIELHAISLPFLQLSLKNELFSLKKLDLWLDCA
jgi:HPr kinase/phosphorylase